MGAQSVLIQSLFSQVPQSPRNFSPRPNPNDTNPQSAQNQVLSPEPALGDVVELTDVENGNRFDIAGDGVPRQSATVTGGDAFLAVDRDGDGRITSGRELFGDQNGAENGFAELSLFDTNRDKVIDGSDSEFRQLLLFRDANLDGLSQGDELITLAQAGIQSIDLAFQEVDLAASGGNQITQASRFTRTDGTTGLAADVALNFIA